MEQEEHRKNIWTQAAHVLGDSQFAALWLFYVEDMPTAEIARVLRCTRVGVKTALFRARAQLKYHLGSGMGEVRPTLAAETRVSTFLNRLVTEIEHL